MIFFTGVFLARGPAWEAQGLFVSTGSTRYDFAMRLKSFSYVSLFLIVISLPAFAQTTPVVIRITDPMGAVIARAQVQIIPAPDSASRRETDAKGELALDFKLGTSAIFVRRSGFKEFSTPVEVEAKTRVQVIPVVMQTARVSPPQMAPLSNTLTLSAGKYHDPVALTLIDFKAKAHVTITIHNPHSNTDENYSGVPLEKLFTELRAPLGKDLHGAALATYLVAIGSDGYRAVFALAEVDPSFHPGDVIVADAMNGKPLDEESGPFRLVTTEDKRPARCVRNLVSIELKSTE